jgi:hypothetical protein
MSIFGRAKDKVVEKSSDLARQAVRAVKGRPNVQTNLSDETEKGGRKKVAPQYRSGAKTSQNQQRSSSKNASPKGYSERLPKDLPPPVSPNDPPTKELRVIPRQFSKVMDRITPKAIRDRKEHD